MVPLGLGRRGGGAGGCVTGYDIRNHDAADRFDVDLDGDLLNVRVRISPVYPRMLHGTAADSVVFDEATSACPVCEGAAVALLTGLACPCTER